jgi:hypothetical protein
VATPLRLGEGAVRRAAVGCGSTVSATVVNVQFQGGDDAEDHDGVGKREAPDDAGAGDVVGSEQAACAGAANTVAAVIAVAPMSTAVVRLRFLPRSIDPSKLAPNSRARRPAPAGTAGDTAPGYRPSARPP